LLAAFPVVVEAGAAAAVVGGVMLDSARCCSAFASLATATRCHAIVVHAIVEPARTIVNAIIAH
jgi:hypothetical protein